MTTPLYIISRDGQGAGGFLCPPGHWNHEYTLHGYYSGRRKANPDLIAGIEHALEDGSGASEEIRQRVRGIMQKARLIDSDMWERNVYGYFRNSYSPDGADRNVSNAIIVKPRCSCGEEFYNARHLGSHLEQAENNSEHSRVAVIPPPPAHHLAVMCIRRYFPDHEPRLDLIQDPGKGYGSYSCVSCGKTVQYEARLDKLVVVKASLWTYDPVCPEGGDHQT